MKRSPMPLRLAPLERRTPIGRGKPPKRKKRRTPAERQIRELVLERDGGCRLAGHGVCFGPLTYHHRRKEGRGGAYTLANGAALCAHHNGQLEADAALARLGHRLGLVVREGDPEWNSLGKDRTP